MTDNRMYQAMAAESPLMPSNTNSGMQERMKMYYTSLPFQPQFLNFSANIGISATSR